MGQVVTGKLKTRIWELIYAYPELEMCDKVDAILSTMLEGQLRDAIGELERMCEPLKPDPRSKDDPDSPNNERFTVAFGNAFEGIRLAGVFEDHEAALDHADGDEWRIVSIEAIE